MRGRCPRGWDKPLMLIALQLLLFIIIVHHRRWGPCPRGWTRSTTGRGTSSASTTSASGMADLFKIKLHINGQRSLMKILLILHPIEPDIGVCARGAAAVFFREEGHLVLHLQSLCNCCFTKGSIYYYFNAIFLTEASILYNNSRGAEYGTYYLLSCVNKT